MTGRINKIEYEGLTILLTDLSHLSPEEAIEVLEETLVEVPKHGEKSVYSLVDVEGIRFNTDLMKTFNKVGTNNLAYVIATAVTGLTSMTRLLAKGVIKASGRKADFFAKREEGKEWLLKIYKGEN